jgi:hypothetical protein
MSLIMLVGIAVVVIVLFYIFGRSSDDKDEK